MTDEGKLETADLAKQLKLEPKTLRKYLRAAGIKKTEGRYEFKASDVKKLTEIVAEHAAKEATAKTAKKSQKKSGKKE